MKNELTIIERCSITSKYYSVVVFAEDLRRYEQGEGSVDLIFPYLSRDDRYFIRTKISPEGQRLIVGKKK